MFSNAIVDVTISRRVVFGQSCAKVSAGFTNVSSLVVATFDLVYCSLSVLRFVSVGATATIVRKSVLIISHIAFRDCRVHIFPDTLFSK